MATLLVILGLGMLIFFHELGHLVAARYTGLPVLRFSVGMGPVLMSRRALGIEWALSAFPFGGYVMFDGESEAYEKADPWRKIVTAFAGPVANLLIGVLLYIAAASISSGNLAIGGGLEKGAHAMGQLFETLALLFTGQVGINDLGGPVMMVAAGASLVANYGAFLSYLGFLSLNLAVFNLLPIPALDGGQILMTLATAISGRAPSERVRLTVVLGSFALLFGLILWVTFQDVARLL